MYCVGKHKNEFPMRNIVYTWELFLKFELGVDGNVAMMLQRHIR